MKTDNRIYFSRVIVAFALLTFSISCDSGFDAMNTDGSRITAVEPVMQLNTAIEASAFGLGDLQCETSIVKQHMRIFTGNSCGNFNEDIRGTNSSNFTGGYQNQIKELADAMQTEEQGTNLYQIMRIFRAYSFMRITDSNGDVPYSEAGLGFLEENISPAYDSQEEIYTGPNGILEELANASAALDSSAPTDSRDILYQGDIEQWKRFANSLLLRAAMRLSEVQPATAQEYVTTAFNSGLMESNDDNAVIRHSADYNNPAGNSLNGGQAHFNYLVEDFVSHLKVNNDPRLASIAVRYVGAGGSAGHTEANADRDPDNQFGIPMGYDNTNINNIVPPEIGDFHAYSQIDRTRMMDPQAPTFLVTYALQQLLLAEAAHRGWVPGDASTYYESGIEAHMHQISTSYQNTAIAQSDIDQYVQANLLEGGRELEQINTEYWVAAFLVNDEVWANFRRSDYPELAPNPLQSELENTDFIVRFGYPDSEHAYNGPNVEAAIANQGPDELDTRIWWDVN